MPKKAPARPEWYDVLNESEAREVLALDTILAGTKAALNAASQRRDFIARRAGARLKWRLEHWNSKGRPPNGHIEESDDG